MPNIYNVIPWVSPCNSCAKTELEVKISSFNAWYCNVVAGLLNVSPTTSVIESPIAAVVANVPDTPRVVTLSNVAEPFANSISSPFIYANPVALNAPKSFPIVVAVIVVSLTLNGKVIVVRFDSCNAYALTTPALSCMCTNVLVAEASVLPDVLVYTLIRNDSDVARFIVASLAGAYFATIELTFVWKGLTSCM